MKQQIFTIFGVLLNNVNLGGIIGFITIILAQENMADKMNDRAYFLWFVTIPILMELPTMIIVPAVMQKKGRKVASFLVSAPMAISWIIIYFSSSQTLMLIARTFQGFATGGILSVSSVIVSEYSSPEYRGVFLMLGSVLTFFGVWIANLLGTFLKWKTISLILAIIALLSLFLIFTWPESPSWLAFKGYEDECKKSFIKLRGTTPDAIKELNILIEVQREYRKKRSMKKPPNSIASVKEKLVQSDFWKPLMGMCLLLSLHNFSGKISITVFAIQIYTEMTNSTSQAYLLLSVYDITTIVALVLTCYLVKIVPRKVLLIGTGLISSLSMLLIALFMYLIEIRIISEKFRIVNQVIMFFYTLATSLGCGSAPIFMGELVPMKHRGSADALASIYSVGIGLLSSHINPSIMDRFKSPGILIFHGIATLPFLILLQKFLPETRGKTLQEIEDFYIFGKFITRDVEQDELNKLDDLKNID